MVTEYLKKVRLIRESLNKSQDQMADDMRITQAKYARFESGRTKTDLETLLLFCNAVKMDLLSVLTYPERYVNVKELGGGDTVEATLQMRLPKDKKDQVLKLVFGDNVLEILNP